MSLDERIEPDDAWVAAQTADGAFISTYAKSYPGREDVAESFLAYLAARYLRSRITKKWEKTIYETIPNRIAYFDALLTASDMTPFTKTSPRVAGLVIDNDSLSIEASNKAAYVIRLLSPPDASVTVTPESDDTTAATVSAPLTFTTGNWHVPQTVTVTGAAPGAATISHTTSSTSGKYANIAAADLPDVSVTVSGTDNPVSLSVSGNGAVDEGDPALTVTATLGAANATGQALAIPVQVRASGTTASAGDYTLAGTISIADGALSGETDFEAVDDSDVEALEAVVVELGSALPSGLSAGAAGHVTIEVGDNDVPVNACLSATVLSDVQGYAQETNNGDAHVTRWKQALAGFGARNGETEMTATAAKQHAGQFSASRWNPAVTALRCLNGPEVTVAGGNGITEGGDAAFTVTAAPAVAWDVTVTLDIGDDATSDFLAQGDEGEKTVTIPANQPSATLTVSTENDSADEANGVVTATVQTGNDYTVAAAPDDTASVAVTDDDATTVVLSTPDTSAAEGDAADMAEIVLTLGRGLVDGETLVAPLQFAGGAAGTLFTLACPSSLPAGVTCQSLDSAPQVTFAGPASGASAVAVTLSFAAAEDSGTVNETVTVSIPASSSGSAPVLTATGLGGGATGSRTGGGQITITDNDAPAQTNPVSLSVSGNGAVDEGDPALTVTATLGTANATGQALVIPAQVRASGTTASPGDYTLAGTISIADGAISGETDFEAVDDSDVEVVESVIVELGSALPSGLSAGAADHVTIEVGDNDAPVNACLTGAVLSDVQDYAQETGNGAAHVTRWKQALAGFGARNGETEMTAATAQDHADDFWAVRWNPVVTALQCLENTVNTEPGIAVTGGSAITEGGDAVFTVTADPAPAANLAVTLDIEDDANSDFLGASDEGSQTVTIPANQNSATLTLSTVGDSTDEANGVVTATVRTGNGYTVAAGPDNAASVAVADNDATTVVLSTPDTSAAEGDAAAVAEIVLTLGRGLVDGETLAASLQFAGGAAGTLFTLACPNPLPTGVTCQNLDSAPQVTFAGPASGASAVAVALSFTAEEDSGAVDETVTVSIPTSSSGSAPVLTATGLGGGAAGSRSGNGEIAITDDDVPTVNAYAALIAKMYEWRNDPQWKSHKAHTDRWDRALLAFGESVADSTLTPMTADEAQAFADRGWTRWVEVAQALHEIESAGTSTNAEPEIAVTGGSAVTEGGDAVFTVTADPAPTADLAVTLDIEDDATSDFLDDSDEGSHTVTIPANQPSATLTLATENDSTDEADGSVTASVRTGNGYSVAAAPGDTASIAVDDDDTPAVPTLSVAIAPASANEGDTGKSWATVTFGLDPVRAQPTVFKACLAGTASEGEDYRLVGPGDETPLSLTGACHSYTLAANAASGEARLMISGDTAFEPDETVTVELRDPPQGAAVSGGSGTAAYTIVNDDPALAGCVDNALRATVTGYAGDTGESRQYRDRWERVLAALGTSNGYRAMTVAEARDNRDQFDTAQWQPTVDAIECLQLGPRVTIAGGSAITEGGDARFTVTAAPAPAADLEVKLTLADDTASDFLDDSDERTHVVTILAGRNAADLAVSTEDDSTEEADGSVSAVVASGAGYRIGSPGTATVAVSDDDDPAPSTPVVSIAGGSGITEGGAASFTLTAAPAPTGDITVEVDVTDSGSFATAGQTGTQTVTIGATGTAALTVATENDSAQETNGTIAATIQAGTGYTVATSPDDTASVAVADDDVAVTGVPTLSVNDVEVQEGPYRRVTFTVTLSKASDRYVSFYYRVRESSPVSAKRGVDFWASTDKNFAGIRPGQTEYRIIAGMVVDDSHDEDPETFEIVLSDAHGAVIADAEGVATIVNDDPMPARNIQKSVLSPKRRPAPG